MSKLPAPNYTQVPNLLFQQMPTMEESELRVLLAAIRVIVGWHKTAPEPISLSQFRKATGMSNKGVRHGIDLAIQRGWLTLSGVKGKRGTACYELAFEDNDYAPEEHSQTSDCVPEEHSTMNPRNNTKETTLKEIKDSAPVGAARKSSRPRNEIFDLVAEFSFNLKDVPIDKETGGRIGKIKGWLQKQAATLDEVRDFYHYYDRTNRGVNRPKDLTKFAEYFTAFRQNRLQRKPAPATPEVLPLPTADPTEFMARFTAVYP